MIECNFIHACGDRPFCVSTERFMEFSSSVVTNISEIISEIKVGSGIHIILTWFLKQSFMRIFIFQIAIP